MPRALMGLAGPASRTGREQTEIPTRTRLPRGADLGLEPEQRSVGVCHEILLGGVSGSKRPRLPAQHPAATLPAARGGVPYVP
jgi:hypothetical protein